MMSQDDANRQAYLEEARELLSDLESSLLELEQTPDDTDLLHKIFRALHTIKGSGAMFGFDDVAAFTHDVETIFDRIRNGELAVNREILDLSLRARDHISNLIEGDGGSDEAIAATGREILEGFRAYSGESAPAKTEAEEPAAPVSACKPNPFQLLRLRLHPHVDILATGNNPINLLADLEELGELFRTVHIENIECLEDLAPESCLVWWDCTLRTSASRDEVTDVFLFVEDECELTIDVLDDGTAQCGESAHRRLGEILIERGDITQEDLDNALASQPRLGDILTSQGLVDQASLDAALAEQHIVKQSRQTTVDTAEKTTSIRVAADKLDALVDQVGELVIVQAQIKQAVDERGDPLLRSLAEHLERLSDSLRDSTLSIRMLPIGATFAKFRRLVRDLAAELGKEIDLATSGEETELDKTVIERLGDPLVHLLRNSIDHGIEHPAERLAAGKPERGSIRLAAAHSGGEVVITVSDDGAGLDTDAIRAKAEARGLIAPGLELSNKELYHLIFLPGFSTSEQVTNISGRGVGMDVVKRAIDALRGSVQIDSERGVGTSIAVRLPLTLAIIDGLQIQVGNEYYVVPLALVEECVELSRKGDDGDSRLINMRGEIVPCLRLREMFSIEGAPPAIEPVVVVKVEGARLGIAVDRVVGEYQTVIKSLGRLYRDVDEFSGATIRGDGTMALILDIPALARRAAAEQGN